MVRSYRRLMNTTRAVLREVTTMVRRLGHRVRTAGTATSARLQRLQRRLRELRPVVEQVVRQTRARVVGGDAHAEKIVSIFEPHTAVIRKGKKAKPTEFGNLVTIQEAEHQIVTGFDICEGRPADGTLWVPALDRHQQVFGRAPYLATADRGFASAANEHDATTRGVRRVVLPYPGRKTAARRAHEHQQWFRRGRRWRVGSEGRISVLKRRHGLTRCRYHGRDGMHRWVGLGVIADNLVTIARFIDRKTAA
jgi:IS5 family transposase